MLIPSVPTPFILTLSVQRYDGGYTSSYRALSPLQFFFIYFLIFVPAKKSILAFSFIQKLLPETRRLQWQTTRLHKFASMPLKTFSTRWGKNALTAGNRKTGKKNVHRANCTETHLNFLMTQSMGINAAKADFFRILRGATLVKLWPLATGCNGRNASGRAVSFGFKWKILCKIFKTRRRHQFNVCVCDWRLCERFYCCPWFGSFPVDFSGCNAKKTRWRGKRGTRIGSNTYLLWSRHSDAWALHSKLFLRNDLRNVYVHIFRTEYPFLCGRTTSNSWSLANRGIRSRWLGL